MSGIEVVNPDAIHLSKLESLMLRRLLEKRGQYLSQGRQREAHGLGQGIHIVWHTIHEFPEQVPTDWGGL